MSKTKPDKELNRLKHELEKVREQHDAAVKQLQVKDKQLDAAETRESKLKAQEFENENEALRKELATTKEAVRSLKAEDKKEEDARARALRQDQEKMRCLEEGWTNMREQLATNQKEAAKHRTEKEEAEMLLLRTQAMVGTQKASIISLQEVQKQHKKELEDSSQEFKTLREYLHETTKSYEEIRALYDDLMKNDGETAAGGSGAVDRGPQTTNWTYAQLLQKHNDLRTEYTAKDKELKLMNNLYEELLTLAEREELALEDRIGDLAKQFEKAKLEAEQKTAACKTLSQQLAAAKLETKKQADAYEAVKTELDTLKASNAESAAKYQEWRQEMLRVASEAPI